jgi:hypothetical protein
MVQDMRLTLLRLVEARSLSDLLSDLDLTIELREDIAKGGVRFEFRGIHALSITKSARPFYIGSLVISDIKSRQMEGLGFFVEDIGKEFISFYCREYRSESIPEGE